jgi:hypothetical protein
MSNYLYGDDFMGSWLSNAFHKVSNAVSKVDPTKLVKKVTGVNLGKITGVQAIEHAVAQVDPTNKNLPIVKSVTHALAQIDPTNNSLPFAKEIQAGLNVVGTAVGAPGLGTVLSKVGQVHADIIHANQKKPAAVAKKPAAVAKKSAAVAKTTVAAAVKHGMTPAAKTASKGLSMPIIIGIVAVAGVGIYFATKK